MYAGKTVRSLRTGAILECSWIGVSRRGAISSVHILIIIIIIIIITTTIITCTHSRWAPETVRSALYRRENVSPRAATTWPEELPFLSTTGKKHCPYSAPDNADHQHNLLPVQTVRPAVLSSNPDSLLVT